MNAAAGGLDVQVMRHPTVIYSCLSEMLGCGGMGLGLPPVVLQPHPLVYVVLSQVQATDELTLDVHQLRGGALQHL